MIYFDVCIISFMVLMIFVFGVHLGKKLEKQKQMIEKYLGKSPEDKK